MFECLGLLVSKCSQCLIIKCRILIDYCVLMCLLKHTGDMKLLLIDHMRSAPLRLFCHAFGRCVSLRTKCKSRKGETGVDTHVKAWLNSTNYKLIRSSTPQSLLQPCRSNGGPERGQLYPSIIIGADSRHANLHRKARLSYKDLLAVRCKPHARVWQS